MIYILPLVCFILPLVAAIFAMKHCKDRSIWISAACLFALGIWAILQGRQAQGWDGIGYVMLAVFLAGPAMMGLIAGGIWGIFRRRRQGSAE